MLLALSWSTYLLLVIIFRLCHFFFYFLWFVAGCADLIAHPHDSFSPVSVFSLTDLAQQRKLTFVCLFLICFNLDVVMGSALWSVVVAWGEQLGSDPRLDPSWPLQHTTRGPWMNPLSILWKSASCRSYFLPINPRPFSSLLTSPKRLFFSLEEFFGGWKCSIFLENLSFNDWQMQNQIRLPAYGCHHLWDSGLRSKRTQNCI